MVNGREKKGYEFIVEDWGIVDYSVGISYQMQRVERVKKNPAAFFLCFCEHMPVITVGRSGKEGIKKDEYEIYQLGWDIVSVDRGGKVTAHFPGQLIGYTIFSLKDWNLSPVRYLSLLESCLLEVCRQIGIEGLYTKDRGIWYSDGKLVSFGIGIKRWIVYHGFSINYRLHPYVNELLFPCGQVGKFVSVEEILSYSVRRNDLVYLISCAIIGALLGSEKIKTIRR